jgi:hypothetical protein
MHFFKLATILDKTPLAVYFSCAKKIEKPFQKGIVSFLRYVKFTVNLCF